MSNKKLYLVETVSMFRLRYVIEAEDASQAEEDVILNTGELKEFSQQHLEEVLVSTRKINMKKYVKLFDKDNGYLSSWTDKQKESFINKLIDDEEDVIHMKGEYFREDKE